jgi:hypothetical protein
MAINTVTFVDATVFLSCESFLEGLNDSELGD